MSDPAKRTPLPRHGGDLAHATRLHGTPPGGWLDLSTGINPYPYPAPPVPADALHRLPDRGALLHLVEVARVAYGVPPGVDLIAVPGTEIAIRLLPLLAPPGPVAIVSPTYGSHADAWPGATAVASVAEVPGDAAIAIVVNPNNPDGRTTDADTLLRLAARHSLVVVDETFADASPENSIIPRMRDTNAVVLRSLGKFYGLAGVRLGVVAAAPAMAARLGALLGDWPVSGTALVIGTAALADTTWRDATRTRLKVKATDLRALLAKHGLAVAGGTDLFTLIDVDDAHVFHDALAGHGIWTRAFADQPRWLRFGLPDDAGMARLAAALSALR